MKSLRRGRAELFGRQDAGRTAANGASTNGRSKNGSDGHHGDAQTGLARRIIDQAPVLLFAVDPDGVITLSEGGLLATLGLVNGESVGLHQHTVYPDAVDFDDHFKRALVGGNGQATVRVGSRILDIWYGPRRDATGVVTGVIGLATEVDGSQQAPALQSQQITILRRILQGVSVGESLQAIRSLVETSATDLRCDVFVPDPLVPPTAADEPWTVQIVTDAGEVVGSVVGKPSEERSPTGEEHALLTLSAQLAAIVVERDRGRERITNAVLRDPLTGLPSRSQLLRTLDQMIRERVPPAVLFCSLDRFKLVNDSLGPDFGDRVLSAVAARLRATVREADVVARVGGDEFAILLTGMTDGGTVEQMARRILSRVITPMAINGRRLLTTMSIGIALPDADDSAADLLRRADAAMSQAKRRGRERYVVHQRSTEANTALSRLELESQIRTAIDCNELRLHFQPIHRCDNGRVALLEALVRWEHPERGLIPPGEFLPAAEEAGLLSAIDRWVLIEACRQVASAGADGAPPVVSVNLAGLPFDTLEIVPQIIDDACAAGFAPQQLIIEVTENLLGAEEIGAVDAFERLRAHGVRIAVDDFGTGYSSLNRLKSLPVDLLKIDRAFVEGLGDEPEASALLDAIVTMGHALGLEIVAEGVETATQLAEIQRLGCDMAQGYYLGRPMPLADLRPGDRIPG